LRRRSGRVYLAAPTPVPEGFVPLAGFAPGHPPREAQAAAFRAGRAKGRRDYAEAVLAKQLGEWAGEALAITLVDDGLVLDLSQAEVFLDWGENGRLDAVHLGAIALAEPSPESLHAAATAITRLLDPIFSGRGRGFGRTASWRTFIDGLMSHAASWARQTRHDCRPAMDAVLPLAEAVIAAAGLRLNPRLDWVPIEGDTLAVPIKSACCLIYRVRERPESPIGGYCTICPLIPDVARAEPVREALVRERRLTRPGAA